MKKSPKISNIQNLLFKPLSVTDSMGQRMIVIISTSTEIKTSLDVSGAIVEKMIENIKFIDIVASLQNGEPIFFSNELGDVDKFIESSKEIDPKTIGEELLELSMMVSLKFELLAKEMSDCQSFLSVFKKLIETSQSTENLNLILGGSKGQLAHIVLNSVNGKNVDLGKSLNQKDIEKIGGVLIEILMENIDIDPDDPQSIKNLSAEIEYKILEAMPNTIKTGDINLNMEFILKEIENLKQQAGDTDDE